MGDDSQSMKVSPLPKWPWVLPLLFIASIFLGNLYVIYCRFKGRLVDSGQFGDSFGSVNALFTGLGLAGVVYAIVLQSRELELQRQSFEANRRSEKENAELQSQVAGALLRQSELSLISSQLNALSISMNRDQKVIDTADEDSIPYINAQVSLANNLIRLDLLLRRHPPEADADWNGYLKDRVNKQLKNLELQKAFFSQIRPGISGAHPGHATAQAITRQRVMIQMFSRWPSTCELLDDCGEKQLRDEIQRSIIPVFDYMSQHQNRNIDFDDSCFDIAKEALEGIARILSG